MEEDNERDDDAPNVVSLKIPERQGGGKLIYYANKQDFYAICGCHGSLCRKVRTSRVGTATKQGRPLGALIAWLMDADSFSCAKDHKTLWGGDIDYETRCVARAVLEGILGGATLLEHERDCEASDGLDGEPRLCP